MSMQGIYVQLSDLIAMRASATGATRSTNQQARNVMFGDTASRMRGPGIAFEEVRLYQPGDDVRAIDWRVTARTGVPHSKVFSSERELPCHLVVDQRPGMFFGSTTTFKSVLAAQIAALLAWQALAAGERVGAQIITAHGSQTSAARRGRPAVLMLINQLCIANQQLTRDMSVSQPPPSLASILKATGRVTARGAQVFLVSDLHDVDSQTEQALAGLAQQCTLTLIQIRDRIEHELPVGGLLGISNGEQRQQIYVSAKFRQHYRDRIAAQQTQLTSLCRRYRARLIQLRTTDPASAVFAHQTRLRTGSSSD